MPFSCSFGFTSPRVVRPLIEEIQGYRPIGNLLARLCTNTFAAAQETHGGTPLLRTKSHHLSKIETKAIASASVKSAREHPGKHGNKVSVPAPHAARSIHD